MDFFVPRLKENIFRRETLDDWHDSWLAVTLAVWDLSRMTKTAAHTHTQV